MKILYPECVLFTAIPCYKGERPFPNNAYIFTKRNKKLENKFMSKITVIESRKIEAPAAVVYNILADYNHHRNILPPKFFPKLDVVEGGVGAGTRFTLYAKSFGGETQMHMAVTEPEPGSVLVEQDENTGLVTTFTVKPISTTESQVTFETVWQPQPGLKGVIDRVTTPFFMHIVYRQEVEILNAYAQQQVQLGQTAVEKNKNET